MESENKSTAKWIEDSLKVYPNNLQAKHIAEFLGIGLGTAYKFIESGEFPILKLPGSKFILVPKKEFINWYAERIK